MENVLVRDKSFYKLLIALTLPLVLKNLITTSIAFADNLMVASLGDAAVNGAQTANQLTNFLFTILMNISAAVTVLATQYWGRKDVGSIKTIVGIGLKFSALLGAIGFVLGFFFTEFTLGLFTNDAAAIQAGTGYLKIVSFTFLLYSLTDVLVASMTSVENVRIGMTVSVIASVTNVVLNYLFIFGLKIGAVQLIPACGVEGAAIATLISRVVELALMIGYLRWKDKVLKIRIRDLLRGSKTLLKDFLRYGLPILGGGAVWAVNVSVQGAIIGHLGVAEAITAYSVANTLFTVITVFVFSTANATGIIIGKTVGSGDVERVKLYARTMQLIFLGLGILTGLALFACQYLLPVAYPKITEGARQMSAQFLRVLAVTTVGTAYQACSLSGIVRAGGDTKFVFLNDTIWVFLVVLPSAWLAGYVFHASPWLVFFLLKGDQLYKCAVAVVKVNRFKWIRNITRDGQPEQKPEEIPEAAE